MQSSFGRSRQVAVLVLTSAVAVAVVTAVAFAGRGVQDSVPGRADISRDQAESRDRKETPRPNRVRVGAGQGPLVPEDCPRGQLNTGIPEYGADFREVLAPEVLAARWLAGSDLEARFPDLSSEIYRTDTKAHVAFTDPSGRTVGMIFFENVPDRGWRIELMQSCSS